MSNIVDGKKWRKIYPVRANETSRNLKRCEPLLTTELLVSRFLPGIPLVSPLTKKKITNKDLKDHIIRAINEFETDFRIDVMPVEYNEHLPFDRSEYNAWIRIHLPQKPVSTILEMAIKTADDQNIYTIPPEWIDTVNLVRGLINVVPLNSALGQSTITGGGQAFGGSIFITAFGGFPWVPALWFISYITGFEEGQVPVIVNEAIGIYAAIELLSSLQVQYSQQSASLTYDGISQATTSPGPKRYQDRIDLLGKKLKKIEKKLKMKYGHKIWSDNV